MTAAGNSVEEKGEQKEEWDSSGRLAGKRKVGSQVVGVDRFPGRKTIGKVWRGG